MSDEAPPTPTPEKPPAPAQRLPLLEWHARRKGVRDLLCLAAMIRGWDFRQEAGSIGEVRLTETEYDEAVAAAQSTWDTTRAAAKGSRVALLAHPASLLAVIVRKPTLQEIDRLGAQIAGDDVTEDQAQILARDDLAMRMLWPAQATPEFIFLMEEAPWAFGQVFPQLLMAASGHARGAARKGG